MFSKLILPLIWLYIIHFINFASQVEGYNHMGCYRQYIFKSDQDKLKAKVVKRDAGTPDSLLNPVGVVTPTDCIAHCTKKGFGYVRITANYCYCSRRSIASRYSLDETECNYDCGNDKIKKCGGSYSISHYEIFEPNIDAVSVNYLGCAIDTHKISLYPKEFKEFSERLTPEICLPYCLRNGYRFAAIKDRKCSCGDSYPANSLVNKDECNWNCTDSIRICGGPERSSLYKTGITDDVTNVSPVGCYKYDKKYDQSYSQNLTKNNSPSRCINLCRITDGKYSAVMNGSICKCIHEVSKNLRVPESECAMPCPGNSRKVCGGLQRMLVFSNNA